MKNEQLVSIVDELVEEISESFYEYSVEVAYVNEHAIIIADNGEFLKVFVNENNIFEVELYEQGGCVVSITFNSANRTNAILRIAKTFVPDSVIADRFPSYVEGLPD
jgi:hypothetical protein